MALNPLAAEFSIGFELDEFNDRGLYAMNHISKCATCRSHINHAAILFSMKNWYKADIIRANGRLVAVESHRVRKYMTNMHVKLFNRPLDNKDLRDFAIKLDRTLACTWKAMILRGLLPNYDISEKPKQTYEPPPSGEDEQCSICLTEFEQQEPVFQTSCNHMFHFECVTKWFRSDGNRSCPLCRTPIEVDQIYPPEANLLCPVAF